LKRRTVGIGPSAAGAAAIVGSPTSRKLHRSGLSQLTDINRAGWSALLPPRNDQAEQITQRLESFEDDSLRVQQAKKAAIRDPLANPNISAVSLRVKKRRLRASTSISGCTASASMPTRLFRVIASNARPCV
jgi:hypothetical protein